MKKRLVSLLLAFSMMLTFLPMGAVPAFAADGEFNDGTLNYTVISEAEKTAKVSGVFADKSTLTEVTIPAKVTNEGTTYEVTEIGEWAFSKNGPGGNDIALKKVTFAPDSKLKTIGYSAVKNSKKLESVELPASVETIGGNAFYGCEELDEVTVPTDSKLTTIGNSAFQGCGFSTFELPSQVKTIGSNVFNSCANLQKIILPKTLTTLGIDAFFLCDALTVYYDGTKAELQSGPLNNKRPAEYLQKRYVENTLTYHDIQYKCTVNYDAKDGIMPNDAPTEVWRNDVLSVTPTKEGYKFTGWTADPAKAYDATNHKVLDDVTLTAGWDELPNVTITVPNNVTVKVGNDEVTPDQDGKISVEKGKEVTLTAKDNDAKNTYEWTKNGTKLDDVTGASYTFTADTDSDGMTIALKVTKPADPVKPTDPTKPYTIKVVDGTVNGQSEVSVDATDKVTLKPGEAPDGMSFQYWDIPQELMDELSKDPNFSNKKPDLSFDMSGMKAGEYVIRAAFGTPDTVDDTDYTALGIATGVVGGTVVAGILGWQAYSLASQSYLELFLPYIPSNRAELAMLLWEDAGKPELTVDNYTDIDADKTDLQKATHWAVAEQLMDEADPEDEHVFAPNNGVSKWTIIKAWNKAQKLKKQ